MDNKLHVWSSIFAILAKRCVELYLLRATQCATCCKIHFLVIPFVSVIKQL